MSGRVTRREFLWTTAASGLVVPLGLRAQTENNQSGLFRHGVASGDPLANRVILWTRVTPRNNRTNGAPNEVRWTIAANSAMTQVVATGTAFAASARDYTVKVDVGGLEPARTYFYAFETGSERSPIGRTRTLPAGSVDRVRLAVVCCANYPAGYFNVYRCVANVEELDVVVHVGDYIYEFENGRYGAGNSMGRIPDPPGEAVTLSDYRRRYAGYRTDADLQEVHRQHPFIAVWDDHEIANDAWRGGGVNHNPEQGEGAWETRRRAAFQAYLEWMPIRDPRGSEVRLYRNFRFGTLADLMMLDTRALRDKQVPPDDVPALNDKKRTLMGAAQEKWLFDQLRTSQRNGTPWKVIGQQVLFSRLSPPDRPVQNPDGWDGYQASRENVIDLLEREKVKDVAILTGDVHSSWAFDVPRNPWNGYRTTGEGSLAVELVSPAVSSPPLFTDETLREQTNLLKALWPHLKFLDGEHRGYVLVEITPKQLQAEWYHVPTVTDRSAQETRASRLICERGSSHLQQA